MNKLGLNSLKLKNLSVFEFNLIEYLSGIRVVLRVNFKSNKTCPSQTQLERFEFVLKHLNIEF